MRTLTILLVTVVVFLPSLAGGQTVPSPPGPEDAPPPFVILAQGPGGFPPPPGRMMGPGPGGWWKDSEAVKKLGLSEAQVGQIEQTFLAHRLRLVDLRADLEKQELGLQPLLDADRPDEGKVAAQLDLITAARGRLEKGHALMLLAVRRVLSTEQWKRLQALHQERAGESHGGYPIGPPRGTVPEPGRQFPPPAPR